MTTHQRGGNGGRHRTMQQLAHDRTLPGSIEVETYLPRLEDLLHANSHRGIRDAVDVATRRCDGVDRARLAAERDDARRQVRERFVVDGLSGFGRIVERKMTGDAHAAEGDIDTAA